MPIFKNVACGLVDDCPNEVFNRVGREGLGCVSCWAANAYPHKGGFWVGGMGIWKLVMMQLMMCTARTLSWFRLGDEACPRGERRSRMGLVWLSVFLLSKLMVGIGVGYGGVGGTHTVIGGG